MKTVEWINLLYVLKTESQLHPQLDSQSSPYCPVGTDKRQGSGWTCQVLPRPTLGIVSLVGILEAKNWATVKPEIIDLQPILQQGRVSLKSYTQFDWSWSYGQWSYDLLDGGGVGVLPAGSFSRRLRPQRLAASASCGRLCVACMRSQ